MTRGATATDNVVDMVKSDQERVFESADEILGTNDVEYTTVSGWKGTIRIQSLTAGDMIEWSEANEGEAKRTAGLRLIIKSVVNSEGSKIFTEKHLGALRLKNHAVTERIVRAILKLNGIVVKGLDVEQTAVARKND